LEIRRKKSKKFFLQHRLIDDLKKISHAESALHPNVAAAQTAASALRQVNRVAAR
jgi:hypothetical protein